MLWRDGAHDARENMRARRGAARARGGGRADAAPVLRLFTFAPAGITLGLQPGARARARPRARCARDGVEWAVRPTGGRAIFHERGVDLLARHALPPVAGRRRRGGLRRAPCALLALALRRWACPSALVARQRRAAPARRARAGGPPRPASPRPPATSCARRAASSRASPSGACAARCCSRAACCSGTSHLRLADYLRLDAAAREAARAALAAGTAHAGAIARRGRRRCGFSPTRSPPSRRAGAPDRGRGRGCRARESPRRGLTREIADSACRPLPPRRTRFLYCARVPRRGCPPGGGRERNCDGPRARAGAAAAGVLLAGCGGGAARAARKFVDHNPAAAADTLTVRMDELGEYGGRFVVGRHLEPQDVQRAGGQRAELERRLQPALRLADRHRQHDAGGHAGAGEVVEVERRRLHA